jgi:hypothetical protein
MLRINAYLPLSQWATFPWQLVSQLLALVRRIVDSISYLLWHKEPFRPTLDELAIAHKVELLKRGALKIDSAPLQCRRLLPLSPPVQTGTVAADSLALLISRFLTGEFNKWPDKGEAVRPLLNKLSEVIAKREAHQLQKIAFPSHPAAAQLSDPLKVLCSIGQQMGGVAFKEIKAVDPSAQAALQLAAPLVEPFLGLLLQALADLINRIDYPALFDKLVGALLEDTKALAKANDAWVLERKRLKQQRAEDPSSPAYLKKLIQGEQAYRRLSDEEKRKIDEHQLAKIKRKFPQLKESETKEWAHVETEIQLYLRESFTAAFAESPHCKKEVAQLLEARREEEARGYQRLDQERVRQHVHTLAGALADSLFPVVKREFCRSILPPLLAIHLSAAEVEQIMPAVEAILPPLWTLYKGELVKGLAGLLERTTRGNWWDELLAREILPSVQDLLMKQQCKMTLKAHLERYGPWLYQYSFSQGDEREKSVQKVKDQLQLDIASIPISGQRFDTTVRKLLLQLHQEQFLLRNRLLASLQDESGSYYMQQIRQIDIDPKANAIVLDQWQKLLGVEKGIALAFCQYAQPLINAIAIRLRQKEKGERDGEVFRKVLDDVPAHPDVRWGEWVRQFVFKYDAYAPKTEAFLEKRRWLGPFKAKISETFTDGISPWRDSHIKLADQLVGFIASKLNIRKGCGVDPIKAKELLFDSTKPLPNPHSLLREEMETTAKLTYSLLIDQVAPQLAPMPGLLRQMGGKRLAQEVFKVGLTGGDPSHINEWAQKVLKGMLENPYVLVNRLQHVVDETIRSIGQVRN